MDRRNFLRSSIAAGVGAALPASQIYAAMRSLSTPYSDIVGVSGSGDEVVMSQDAVQDLSDSLRGNLLLPGNDGYDKARLLLNKSFDKHPALVVQPSGAVDVQRAVSFARENDLLLAVKCGGHSFSGKSSCDNGMQIDLTTLRHVRIDANSRSAFVAGGSLLGEMDRESMAHGLVTTAGTVSHTGVGGLTLGGGFGRVGRRFGLALDNVKSLDVVTADGQLRHASAEENPDLYWGLRGGGGNFGVVTAFEFALHPMQRQVFGGDILFPISMSREFLKFYGEFCQSAPDDLYCDGLLVSPAGSSDGMCGVHLCYSGPAGKVDEVLAPVRKLGKPVVDSVAAIDYVELQRLLDNLDPRVGGQYSKGGFVNEIPDSLAEKIADGFDLDPGRSTTAYFQHSGGAIGRVAAEATAFPHRRCIAGMYLFNAWPEGADPTRHIDYTRSYWKTLETSTDGYYTNDTGDEPQAMINANYQVNFDRLLTVKNQYDPGNLFRLNANIKPTA
jgi:FAD binding domain/Berberine and berberine like